MTLRGCRFAGDLEADDFAPRAYCMDLPADVGNFYDDYRKVAAECVLCEFVRSAAGHTSSTNPPCCVFWKFMAARHTYLFQSVCVGGVSCERGGHFSQPGASRRVSQVSLLHFRCA